MAYPLWIDRIAYLHDLQAGTPIGHVGVLTRHHYIPSMPADVIPTHPPRIGWVADVDDFKEGLASLYGVENNPTSRQIEVVR